MTEITVSTEEEFLNLFDSDDVSMLVLFTAPSWCVPCQRFEPHWNLAQNDARLSDFLFVKVDMGATPEDTGAHWATDKYDILSVPQVLLVGPESGITIHARAVIPFIKEVLEASE